MSRPAVVSMLWPKNEPVAVELVKRGCDVLRLPPGGPFGGGNAGLEAASRCEALERPLAARFGENDLGMRMAASMLHTLHNKLAPLIGLVDELERLGANSQLSGVVLNESETPIGKTAALWASAHAIPVFMLSHGANMGNAYTVTRSTAGVDYVLVFGERGAEPYLDLGFPSERIGVTGNPAWDGLAAPADKASARARVLSPMNLDPSLPLVLFATTWNAKLSALVDANLYRQTLRGFLFACRRLQDAGLRFHAIVKDRPPNAAFGMPETERLAREAGCTNVVYANGDLHAYLAAADLMVAYESSAFVESAIHRVPAIALWHPSCWLNGPSFDLADGIPLVRYSLHEALAGAMRTLLEREDLRSQVMALMQARLPRFHAFADGNSAARCADFIAARLRVPVPATATA